MTKNRIEEMLRMQDMLNTNTAGDNWKCGTTDKGRKIDWGLCIMMEGCELIDSLNWKHWKDIYAISDIDNAKVEAIDILHFALSEDLRRGKEIGELTSLISDEVDVEQVIAMTRDVIDIATNSDITLTPIALDLCGALTMEADEVYGLYIGKNVLNKFRQDNGYAEGNYVKMWNGKEDNVFMKELIKDFIDAEDLYKKLSNTYKKYK